MGGHLLLDHEGHQVEVLLGEAQVARRELGRAEEARVNHRLTLEREDDLRAEKRVSRVVRGGDKRACVREE